MKHYFSPGGRSGRAAWWLGNVFLYIISIALLLGTGYLAQMLGFIDWATALAPSDTGDPPDFVALLSNPGVWMVLAAYLLTTYMAIVLSVRRLHDRGKSGWWLLLMVLLSVIIIGAIWMLVELGFLAGQPGPNRYGASKHSDPGADQAHGNWAT
ncbi:MAG: DUF805 domain-containing protein [Pseudomonadota bacterium]